MKRGILAAFAVVLAIVLSNTASAAIVETGLKDYYNLGDGIKTSYTLLHENDVSGIFKVGIFCSGYDIDYFATPVTVKASQTKLIETDELKPSATMLGNCMLKAQLQSFDKNAVEEHFSDNFTVTGLLVSNVEIKEQSFLPGEPVTVTGIFEASYGYVNGTVMVKFDDTTSFLPVTKGLLNYTTTLSKSIKSGNHSIRIKVNDSFGNSVEEQLSAYVLAVPSSIVIAPNPDSLNPEETAKIRAILYDQANDTMDGEILIEILGFDGKELFNKNLTSNSVADFKIPPFYPPGSYSIKAYSSKITSKSAITVKKLELLDISFDNRTAYVKNMGNVEYKRSVELRLASGDEDYSIVKQVSIKPNETIKIDIFTEVPAGSYNVTMPAAVTGNAVNKLTFSNVVTKDERNVFKKLADGSGELSGFLVGKGKKKGILLQMPVLASFIVLAAVAAVVVFYARKGKKALKSAKAEKSIEMKKDETKEETELFFPEKKEIAKDTVKKNSPELERKEAERFIYDTLKEKKFK